MQLGAELWSGSELAAKLVLLAAAGGVVVLLSGGSAPPPGGRREWDFQSTSRCHSAISIMSPGSASIADFPSAPVRIQATAGMPPPHTCITCQSRSSGPTPISSRRFGRAWRPVNPCIGSVNQLPDYVYFDRWIIAKGSAVPACHGRIDTMPLTAKAVSLRMAWCVDCHRDPRSDLRPRRAVFDMGRRRWRRRAVR